VQLLCNENSQFLYEESQHAFPGKGKKVSSFVERLRKLDDSATQVRGEKRMSQLCRHFIFRSCSFLLLSRSPFKQMPDSQLAAMCSGAFGGEAAAAAAGRRSGGDSEEEEEGEMDPANFISSTDIFPENKPKPAARGYVQDEAEVSGDEPISSERV
jgi:hypothetical protein